jgi:hypothetical protein
MTTARKEYATWLERDGPGAAGLLREGPDEMFTINRLSSPSEMRQCLGTTNLIDNGHVAQRNQVRWVKNGQIGAMALRWAVTSEAIAKGFRRNMGYQPLGRLKAALDEPSRDWSRVDQARAGSSRITRGRQPIPVRLRHLSRTGIEHENKRVARPRIKRLSDNKLRIFLL